MEKTPYLVKVWNKSETLSVNTLGVTEMGVEYIGASSLEEAKALRAERFAQGGCRCAIVGTFSEIQESETPFSVVL